MSKIAVEGYNHGLAPHHGWMLKKVATVAMKAIKDRTKFMKGYKEQQSRIQGKEYDDEMCFEDFRILSEESATLATHLWAFCRENGFDQLP